MPDLLFIGHTVVSKRRFTNAAALKLYVLITNYYSVGRVGWRAPDTGLSHHEKHRTFKVLDRINTGFERMNAGLDRLSFLPVAFVAILGLVVIATVALEQNAGARAAANFIELQG